MVENGMVAKSMLEKPAVAGVAWKEKLRKGMTGEASVVVAMEHTASALGSGSVPVFATPALAALVEAAALDALQGVLDDDQTSVGVYLDLQHQAATPVGLTVRAEARIINIEGRRLTFRVAAFDDVEQIGAGTHQRMIVDTDRFLSRTAAKRR